MNKTPSLILASQSPRRAALLRDAGVAFEQRSPPFADPDQPPGDLCGHEAEAYAVTLAQQKARSLAATLSGADTAAEPTLILAADTICVDAAGALVGKPRDREHAGVMLRSFADCEHRVITGVALLGLGPTGESDLQSFADSATVCFGCISEQLLADYLATDDWQGKAGGYNLFDRQAAGWPIDVVGDPTTVVGLPMKCLMPMIQTMI